MDFNIEARLKQLQSLENFISYSRDKVQSILDCLQWNVNDTLKETSLIRCSIDPNHTVSVNTVEAHTMKCLLKKDGYNVEDNFLSEPVTNVASSIQINNHMKIKVLSAARQSIPDFRSAWNGQDPDPQTSDRLLVTFSPDERLALYDYAVKNTTGPVELPEFNVLQPVNNESSTLTNEEMLRKERDAKRRRIKYKSVHTNRKSYTEIMREVINGQMELYSDWVNSNDGKEKASSQESTETNSETTNKHSDDYTESIRNSRAVKFNSDRYSNSRDLEYSHKRHFSDNSHRTDRSHSRDRKHKYNHNEHTSSSYRSRSRSSGRHKKAKHYRSRSRSRSKDRSYTRHRR